MKRISMCLLLVLTLSLFGHVVQRACEAIGIPFLTVTVFRDMLLFVLFVWTMMSVPLLEARGLNSLLLLFAALFAVYVFVSAFENRFVLGLYYLRLYLLPVMFFVVAKVALERLDSGGVNALLRSLIAINGLMLLTATAFYLTIIFLPQQRSLIFGTNLLPFTWFAAGEGANLMRMGLPMTGPNHLGVYFGMMMYLFLVLATVDHQQPSRRTIYWIIIVMNMMGLAATFSRSSMLFVLVAVVSLFILVPDWRAGRMFMRGWIIGLTLLAATVGGLAVIEWISDGFVTRWIALNMKLQDPSLIGHWQSLVDAYDNFERYYLYGYPRGTVGPRAFLFYVSDRFNVENSLLSAVYDLGVIGAAVLAYGYYRMLSLGYRCRYQLALVAGFLVCSQFLPYVFEPVVMCLFFFVFLLIGQLDQLGSLAITKSQEDRVPLMCRLALRSG
jgi:hypothetical protein